MKFIPFILICALGSPDQDCRLENKNITVVKGEPQITPMSCLMAGQSQAASLAFAPRENDNYYIRIKCVPTD